MASTLNLHFWICKDARKYLFGFLNHRHHYLLVFSAKCCINDAKILHAAHHKARNFDDRFLQLYTTSHGNVKMLHLLVHPNRVRLASLYFVAVYNDQVRVLDFLYFEKGWKIPNDDYFEKLVACAVRRKNLEVLKWFIRNEGGGPPLNPLKIKGGEVFYFKGF